MFSGTSLISLDLSHFDFTQVTDIKHMFAGCSSLKYINIKSLVINDNIEYINKEIYIVQYPKGNKLSYSEGKIININNNELIHDASTTSGSSGSPILIKNTIEVIGIHKQGSNKKT